MENTLVDSQVHILSFSFLQFQLGLLLDVIQLSHIHPPPLSPRGHGDCHVQFLHPGAVTTTTTQPLVDPWVLLPGALHSPTVLLQSCTRMIFLSSAIYKLNSKRNHCPSTDRTTAIKFSFEKGWGKRNLWPQFLFLCIQATERKVYLTLKMGKYLTERKLRIRE